MERLLAYEGPVVHVDHSTARPRDEWSNRDEIEKEKRSAPSTQGLANCNQQSSWKDKRIAELQAQVVAKDDELLKSRNAAEEALAKSRDSKQSSIRKLMDQESEADAQIAELQQRVKSMTSEKETLLEYYTQKFKRVKELEAENDALEAKLADDNKNYTKLLQGVSNEAKSKFQAAHAMAALEVGKDPEALQYVQWIQTKLAQLPKMDEAAAKRAVGGDQKWF